MKNSFLKCSVYQFSFIIAHVNYIYIDIAKVVDAIAEERTKNWCCAFCFSLQRDRAIKSIGMFFFPFDFCFQLYVLCKVAIGT